MCKNFTSLFLIFSDKYKAKFRFKAQREMLPLGGRATKLRYKVTGIEKEKVLAIFAIYHMSFDHNFDAVSSKSTDAVYQEVLDLILSVFFTFLNVAT